MKRVLVTGATGFVGAATIAPLLDRGYEVHCIGRSAPATRNVRFRRFDLLADDPAPLLDAIAPTHLLHLAWHDDRATIWHSPRNLAWTAASLRLALAFRQARGRRAVFAGSVAQYDWSRPLLDDDDPRFLPATPYGRAKQALHDPLAAGDLAPVSIGWAVIFFPFGPHDKPDRLLSEVIDRLSSGGVAQCSAGDQVRPFIHVDDAGRALAALLDSAVEGPVNIALEETCSVREIALAAARHVGDPARIVFGTRALAPGEPIDMRATTHRLRRQVGFTPLHTIASGVAATVRDRLDAAGVAAGRSDRPGVRG